MQPEHVKSTESAATETNAHRGVVARTAEELCDFRAVVWQTDVVAEAAGSSRPKARLKRRAGRPTDWLAGHRLGDVCALPCHTIEVGREVHWVSVQ